MNRSLNCPECDGGFWNESPQRACFLQSAWMSSSPHVVFHVIASRFSCICGLLKRLNSRTALKICCEAVERVEFPRDSFSMIPGRLGLREKYVLHDHHIIREGMFDPRHDALVLLVQSDRRVLGFGFVQSLRVAKCLAAIE